MNQLHQERVRRLQNQDFEAWKNQPESKIFFNYLKDFREQIGDTYKEQLMLGNLQEILPHVLTMEEGKCVLIEDLLDIELIDIKQFYEVEDSDTEDSNPTSVG